MFACTELNLSKTALPGIDLNLLPTLIKATLGVVLAINSLVLDVLDP